MILISVRNVWKENSLMNTPHIIINIILLLYLLCSSYKDIKTKTIPIKTSIFIAIVCFVANIFIYNIKFTYIIMWMLKGCTVGFVLLLLALITKENIGYGDGLIFLIIGIGTGFENTILTCSLSFILTSIIAILLLLFRHKKNTTIPFVPFICIGYVIQFFLI